MVSSYPISSVLSVVFWVILSVAVTDLSTAARTVSHERRRSLYAGHGEWKDRERREPISLTKDQNGWYTRCFCRTGKQLVRRLGALEAVAFSRQLSPTFCLFPPTPAAYAGGGLDTERWQKALQTGIGWLLYRQ